MRGPTILALTAALGLAGCGERSASTPVFEPIPLTAEPQPGRPTPFLTWGGTVTIDGIPRTVISAAIPIAPPIENLRPAKGQPQIRVQLPVTLRAVPWIILESVVTRNGVTTMMRSWPVTGRQGGTSFDVAVVPARIGPGDTTGVVLWPVLDLAERTVTTSDVRVPERAVLQIGAALEPSSWAPTTVPLDMTVSAVADGGETRLHVLRVDPRRPEYRRWLDLAIPLDALAGRTVRLRFAASPIAGPTAVPSLPVWSLPTIVDARTLR